MSINSSSSHNNNSTSSNAATNAPKPAADMRAYLASAAQAQSALPPPPSMSGPVTMQSTSSVYNNTASGYGSHASGSVGATNGACVRNINPYTYATSSTSNHTNSNIYQNTNYTHTNSTSSTNINSHTSGYGVTAVHSSTSSNNNYNSNTHANGATSSIGQGPPQRSVSMNNPYNTSTSHPSSGYGNANATSSSYPCSTVAGTNNPNSFRGSNMGAPVNQTTKSTSGYGYNAPIANTNLLHTSNAVPSRGYSYPPASTNNTSSNAHSYNTIFNSATPIPPNDAKPNPYVTNNTIYAAPQPAPVVSIAPLAPATSFVVNINGPQEEFAYSASTQASHSSEATSGESKGSEFNQSTGYYNNNTSRNACSTTRETNSVTVAAVNVPQRAAMPVPNGYNSTVNNIGGYANNGPALYQTVPAQPAAPVITPVSIAPLNIPASTFSTVHPGSNPAVPTPVPYYATNINATNIRSSNVPAVPIATIPTSNIAPSTNISSVPATTLNTSIAPMNTTNTITTNTCNTSRAAGKAPLPPDVLARIEANKLAAQARLAAARLQKSTTTPVTSHSSNLASTSTSGVIAIARSPNVQNTASLNHTTTIPAVHAVPAVPPAMAMSPANKGYRPTSTPASVAAYSVGSPVALQAAIQSRQATANVPPPGVVKGANAAASRLATSHYHNTVTNTTSATANGTSAGYGYGANSSAGGAQLPQHSASVPAAHVFSTGRGTSIPVSDAKIQQAAVLLDSAILPTGPSRVVQGHAPSHTTNSEGHSTYVNSSTGQYVTTAPAVVPTAMAPSPAAGVPLAVSTTDSYAAANAVISNHTIAPIATTSTSTSTSTSTATTTSNYTSGTLYFDGTAQSSLQRGGAGYQLFANNGRTIRENGVRMSGTCSSNQAEYVGLIQGLTAALHCGVQDLQVFGDSEVVIKQMLGLYPVRNPALQGMFTRAKALQGRFRRIQLQWVPKEKNTGADALCQRALLQPETVAENCDWFVSSVV